jgi:hypothetical protein
VADWRQVSGEETRPYWQLEENGSLITLRPHQGDAGRWEAKAFCIPANEPAGFPRYYMDLTVACHELKEFLDWRLRVAGNRSRKGNTDERRI